MSIGLVLFSGTRPYVSRIIILTTFVRIAIIYCEQTGYEKADMEFNKIRIRRIA